MWQIEQWWINRDSMYMFMYVCIFAINIIYFHKMCNLCTYIRCMCVNVHISFCHDICV